MGRAIRLDVVHSLGNRAHTIWVVSFAAPPTWAQSRLGLPTPVIIKLNNVVAFFPARQRSTNFQS